jgi:hypothetical protein
MYKAKAFNYDSWCIGRSGIGLYGPMVGAWLQQLFSRFAFFLAVVKMP